MYSTSLIHTCKKIGIQYLADLGKAKGCFTSNVVVRFHMLRIGIVLLAVLEKWPTAVLKFSLFSLIAILSSGEQHPRANALWQLIVAE